MLVHKNVFVSFTKFLIFGICWIVLGDQHQGHSEVFDHVSSLQHAPCCMLVMICHHGKNEAVLSLPHFQR